MQYTVKAKASTAVTIDTDTRQRAIELAGVFHRNGWENVRVEVGGQEFFWPKLQRELP